MFVCEKCNKEFKYNSLLQRHLDKKISCVKYENIINDNLEDLLKAMENIEQQIYVKNKKTITITRTWICRRAKDR